MQVTLAMGLQYNSYQGKEQPISGSEGKSFDLSKENIASPTSLSTNPVIDVQAIADSIASKPSLKAESFDYLAYNLHAALVFLPSIGTQIDMTI